MTKPSFRSVSIFPPSRSDASAIATRTGNPAASADLRK